MDKVYRSFVTRHYIAVEWYDVVAPSAKKARRLAEKAARKLRPDVRAEAVDNRWHSDEPIEIECLGYSGENGEYTEELVEIMPGVWQSKGV